MLSCDAGKTGRKRSVKSYVMAENGDYEGAQTPVTFLSQRINDNSNNNNNAFAFKQMFTYKTEGQCNI